VLIIFKFFAGFHSHHLETFKPNDARDSSLLGRDDRLPWHREVSWLSNFVAFKTLKFFDASDAFFVEAKLHGESKVIQRCFDDNNDDNKR